MLCLLGRLWIFILGACCVVGMAQREKEEMAKAVKEMFYHGYDNYMAHAFPHDELKSISGTWTDTLAELGNARQKAGSTYSGVAMTLIDSLSTLAVLGNKTEFEKSVLWLDSHISWDQDVRVNLFEVNIRLLGGLLSAHSLALDPSLGLMENYSGSLLRLATDLGDRMMKAFTSDSPLPYAWINLKHGLEPGETREQCTAGIGTLILEFGLLSYYTNDDRYFEAAFDALLKLWTLRSPIDLLGNTLDVGTYAWINNNAGIGSGIDSYYEYLVKAYVLFGNSRFYDMFRVTSAAINKHLKTGDWYVEGSMASGHHTHVQFNSLQAFWPGLQVLVGELRSAVNTQAKFHSLWKRYDGLPERFVLASNSLHSSERHYPLRPEFVESTYHLYKATGNSTYLEMGKDVYNSLQTYSKVKHGYACVRNVETKELEDYMSSYFLAETTKYLYLLFDEDNFAHRSDMLFTTEGHLFPLNAQLHKKFGDSSRFGAGNTPTKATSSFTEWAAIAGGSPQNEWMDLVEQARKPKEMSEARTTEAMCNNPATTIVESEFSVHVGDGSFEIGHVSGEEVNIRNLGTGVVELVNRDSEGHIVAVVLVDKAAIVYSVGIQSEHCAETLAAMGAFFGPLPGLSVGLTRASPGNPSEVQVMEEEDEADLEAEIITNIASLDAAKSVQLIEQLIQNHTEENGGELDDNLKRAIEDFEAKSSETLSLEERLVAAEKVLATLLKARTTPTLSNPGELWGMLVAAVPFNGCETPSNAAALKGNVAFVQRGQCTFLQKAALMEAAGAIGVIVGNAAEDNVFLMGSDGSGSSASIPAMMITSTGHKYVTDCLAKGDVRVGMWREKHSLEGKPFHINERTDERPSSTPSATLSGGLSRFEIRTMGGWTVEVEQKGVSYVLKIF